MAWRETGGNSNEEEKEESMPVYWDGVLIGTWHLVFKRTVTQKVYEQKTHNPSYTFSSLVGQYAEGGRIIGNTSKKNLITGAVLETLTAELVGAWEQDTDRARYEQAPAEPTAPSE